MFHSAQRAVALVAVSSLLLAGAPHAARASWPHDPTINVPVAALAGDQWDPVTVVDGSGGSIVAWYDWRSGNADVYAQRYDASGREQWISGGVLVCGATGDQTKVRMVADGSGGAVLTWQDGRGAATKVYAQRIDLSGAPQWAADGVGIGLVQIAVVQTNPAIAAAAAPAVVITWEQAGNIMAQRLSGAGALLWGSSPLTICSAAGTQQTPVVVYDPTIANPAAVFAWRDDRNGNSDLYAQRVSTAGALQWVAEGIPVCTAGNDQMNLSAYWERTLGVCLAWMDDRAGNWDIYAQRLDAAGAVAWAANGVAVCTAAADQWSPRILTGGTGKLIVGWEDWRTGSADIYAQDLNSAGATLWTANGAPLCTRSGYQTSPVFAADGSGGVIGTWQDQRTLSYDIYAQRLNSSGVAQWTADGVAVSMAFGNQLQPALTMVGSGASVVAWVDYRGGGMDVFMQGVDAHGLLGIAPVLAGVRDVPNDQGGQVSLRWKASPLDSFPAYSVTRYRISVRPPASTTWTPIDSVNAAGLPGYSRVLFTSVDSVAGANPFTSYRVEAMDVANGWSWTSDADSGYSVDNLSPPAPAPFTGTYAGGVATLAWAASPAADLVGYRLCRVAAGGDVQLVATLTGTGYADPAGEPFYYKVTAVDAHGNESAASLVLPTGALDVAGPGATLAFALMPPAPNPLCTATALRFTLPSAGRVTLAVYDAQGRSVRTLLDGVQLAGERVRVWDARDDAGRDVPVGLYLARLRAGEEERVRRIVVTR